MRLALVLFLLVLIVVILSVLVVVLSVLIVVLSVLVVVLSVLVVVLSVLVVVLVLHNEHSFFVIWELHTHYAHHHSLLCVLQVLDCHSK